jgi:hypothetical protein
MSLFVYYNLLFPFGPALVSAQIVSEGLWTDPTRFQSLISYLSTLDFSTYDNRRLALTRLRSTTLLRPQFFFAYPFDPLQYPLLPPLLQVRFPALGVYIYLATPEYSANFSDLSVALSYRDGDSNYSEALAAYELALQSLIVNFSAQRGFYTRESFELENLLLWAIYPPPVPKCPTTPLFPSSHSN